MDLCARYSKTSTADSKQKDTFECVGVLADNLTDDLIGKWCVVNYDGLPYPGIVHDVDEGELEVKVMHKVGNNRYFWPDRDDIVWIRSSPLCPRHSKSPADINKSNRIFGWPLLSQWTFN